MTSTQDKKQSKLRTKASFYGVYLLISLNEKFKGKAYIGFTVNPNRREIQHNAGAKKGGAKKTSGKGPWEMVLIVHGFPSDIAALQFEWAWQNPQKSRRLKTVSKRTSKEKPMGYSLRVMAQMLNASPWKRFPLTIQWLKQEYKQHVPITHYPPKHMSMDYGPIVLERASKQKKQALSIIDSDDDEDQLDVDVLCALCDENCLDCEDTLKCLSNNCTMKAHIICLAKHFLTKDGFNMLPVKGQCPECKIELLWGDLVLKRLKTRPEIDEQCSTPEWIQRLR